MNPPLLKKWIEKESKLSLIGKRRYFHFDRFINFPKHKNKIIAQLTDPKKIATHSFYPFIGSEIISPRFKVVKKDNGEKVKSLEQKIRPIAYAAHFDALVYSWYATILTDQYHRLIKEIGIAENVLAYLETGKCNIDYAFEIFEKIKTKGECAAIALDLSSFFDTLDHAILKKMWCRLLNSTHLPDDHFNLYKSLTAYTHVSKKELDLIFPKKQSNGRYCSTADFRAVVRKGKLILQNPNKREYKVDNVSSLEKCGIPQGSPISAVLSNIYMLEFDELMNKISTQFKGEYRRYCDDILFVCDIADVAKVQAEIIKLVKSYSLKINESKTEVTYFKKENGSIRGYNDDKKKSFRNLQYLGFNFNGNQIYIRESSISRYKRRLRTAIRESIKATYGKRSLSARPFKKRVLRRYSSKGQRNFISYATRAANEIMNSKSIRKQYGNSIENVLKEFKLKQAAFLKNRRSSQLLMPGKAPASSARTSTTDI